MASSRFNKTSATGTAATGGSSENLPNPEIVLFSDIFTVKDVNPGGKNFERVDRITAVGENFEMDLVLDFACELYRLDLNDRFTLSLSKTLDLSAGGQEDSAKAGGGWRERLPGDSGMGDLADQYDYVMYGTVYRFDASKASQAGSKVDVFVSFGGLLMCLSGEHTQCHRFSKGETVYLLVRK